MFRCTIIFPVKSETKLCYKLIVITWDSPVITNSTNRIICKNEWYRTMSMWFALLSKLENTNHADMKSSVTILLNVCWQVQKLVNLIYKFFLFMYWPSVFNTMQTMIIPGLPVLKTSFISQTALSEDFAPPLIWCHTFLNPPLDVH